MAGPLTKQGWAVVDWRGLLVATVSETRRAAIVNWLVTEARIPILNSHTDQQIEALWKENAGSETEAVRVTITLTLPQPRRE